LSMSLDDPGEDTGLPLVARYPGHLLTVAVWRVNLGENSASIWMRRGSRAK